MLAAVGTARTLWLHALLLFGAATLATRLPRPEHAARPKAARSWSAEFRVGLRVNWAIPIERGWVLCNFVGAIVMLPCATMLLPLKVQSLGLSGAWLGMCEAGLSAGMLLGSLGGSAWMVERFGRFNTRVGAAAVQGVCLGLAGATSHGTLLVAGFFVAGFMNAAMVLVGMTHRMLARPQAFRARMVASSVATTNIAAMIGPALAGVALLHLPVGAVFVAFGLSGAFCTLGLSLVPGFREFMALGHEQVDNFYGRHFPHAFEDA